MAVITQPLAILGYLHATFAGYVVAGFFLMAVSAYHILRKNELFFFSRSFRMGLIFALIFSVGQVVVGDLSGAVMAKAQPEKLAAVESVWENTKSAPFYMFIWPDEANERNAAEMFGIPSFLSFIVYHDWDAEIKGLKSWPVEDRPPVTLTFWSFRIMVGLGFLFVPLTLIGIVKRKRLDASPIYLRVIMYSLPLPYLASLLGWIVTEVGRQPWVVYQVLRTANAHSPVAPSQVAISLVAFIVLYTLLGFVAIFMMARVGRRGPEPLEA